MADTFGHDMPHEDGMPAQRRPFQEVMEGVVNRLEAEAKERISRRRLVEERWLTDIAQYEGRDDQELIARLSRDDRSTAVVNVTRPKCNTFESKVFDLLFPTDDRNWGIGPTPVPEMDLDMKKLGGEIDQLTSMANAATDDEIAEDVAQEADQLAQQMAQLEAQLHEARDHADLMAEEIADNLVECEYPVHCRAAIHDATVGGTGFIKGPIPLTERIRKSWMREDGGNYRLKYDAESEGRFAFQHVSYWHLFPESTARSFDKCSSWLERHIMTEQDLRDFAKQPGVDKDAIRRLLDEGPRDTLPEYMLDLDTVVSEEVSSYSTHVYIVWEYRGPLDREDMEMIMSEILRESMNGGEATPVTVEIDPLMQMDAVLFFCQGEALRWGVNHMDDNSPIYSAFQIEKSMARLWGIGIPYLLREQASIINDAWREMMDNAAFAARPQVEIDTGVVQRPEGAPPIIEPGGAWERTSDAGDRPGLIFHDIPIHQGEFAAIIDRALQFVDTETNISVLASGEQGAHTTSTAGGIGLLMNAVNVVFRRVVRNYDDGITTTAIARAYHYLMQFSPKEEIKGDYTVQARGSSVLLVREIQAQNLLLLASQMSVHPVLGQHFKVRALLKHLLQSMHISADDVLKTELELEADMAAQQEAEANAPPDPALVALQLEQQKIEMDGQLSQLEIQGKMQLAMTQIEADLMKMAAQGQITMAEAQARLQGIREQYLSKERIFSAEAAIEARQPADGNGSGGYL